MKKNKLSKIFALLLGIGIVLSGCGDQNVTTQEDASENMASEDVEVVDSVTTTDSDTEETAEIVTNLSQIDMSKWRYNSEDNVWYQLGIVYCEKPADESYENLAIFVPGDYMTGEENDDDTYTCTLNSEANVNGYTSVTAPIILPIETPGYAAQAALTEYTSLTDYTDAGFVYVHEGCRGRDAGAPAGVTDIKAAIRYIRYNEGVIAGNMDRIFVFGMSGGGAQSAIVGATGDSDLYTPYLEEIGAVSGVSDAVLGSMDWCPITNLECADEAYEWMMGPTRSDLSEDDQAVSDSLAVKFAEYINNESIKDPNGNILVLEESSDGFYQSGTYYNYIKGIIEESLNNFLSDTEFPYDADASTGDDGGPAGGFTFGGDFGGEMGGGAPTGDKEIKTGGGDMNGLPTEAADTTAEADTAEATDVTEETNYAAVDDISRTETTAGVTISGVYDTVQDYIDVLNSENEWVIYDETTNTATITSIEDFVVALKPVSKELGAFDQLDASQGENELFGYGDGTGRHFDSMLFDIVKELGNEYSSDFESDFAMTDELGNSPIQRLNMYSPMYFLMDSEDGYGNSTPAKYWRIRTGLFQSDTSLTTEVNLALALYNNPDVESVDFATVWGMEHVKAERTGTSTENFIAWVNDCLSK